MEHSYIKHPCDNENKNVLSIHRSEYMSVVVLGCLVMTTLCLPLYLYSSLPLPPQTFISLCLCCSNKFLSSIGKCVDNRTQLFLSNINDMFSLVHLQLSLTNKLPSFSKVLTETSTNTHYSLFVKHYSLNIIPPLGPQCPHKVIKLLNKPIHCVELLPEIEGCQLGLKSRQYHHPS